MTRDDTVACPVRSALRSARVSHARRRGCLDRRVSHEAGHGRQSETVDSGTWKLVPGLVSEDGVVDGAGLECPTYLHAFSILRLERDCCFRVVYFIGETSGYCFRH